MKRSRRPFISAVYDERTLSEASAPASPAQSQDVSYTCDLCGAACSGQPAGSGLFLWHRGDEMRIEEPPLCERCTGRVTMSAVSKWALEGEEEG